MQLHCPVCSCLFCLCCDDCTQHSIAVKAIYNFSCNICRMRHKWFSVDSLSERGFYRFVSVPNDEVKPAITVADSVCSVKI